MLTGKLKKFSGFFLSVYLSSLLYKIYTVLKYLFTFWYITFAILMYRKQGVMLIKSHFSQPRWLIFCSGLVLTGLLFFQSTADSQQKRPRGPSATLVEAEAPSRRTLKQVLRLAGTATAASRFTLTSQTSGRLLSLPVQVGQYVKKGQLIAQMEAQTFQQDMRQIEADLAVLKAQKKEAQATLTLAEKEFDRDATLYTKKLVSKTELDTSRTTLETQRSRLSVLEAQLQQKKVALQGGALRLSDTKIYARWPGQAAHVVSKRFVDAGAIMSANTPLVECVSLDPIVVRTSVSEKEFTQLNTGQKVNLRSDAYPGRTFGGAVARIAPVLDPETRNGEVEIQVPNPEHLLKPGMFLQGELIIATRVNVPTLPRAALVEKEVNQSNVTGVFLLKSQDEGQKVSFVPVKTGFEEAGFVEIMSPDIQGKVVTLGNHLLQDGSLVRLPQSRKLKTRASRSKRP